MINGLINIEMKKSMTTFDQYPYRMTFWMSINLNCHKMIIVSII